MKYAKIMLGGLLTITATANAMPTPEQTKKVEPLVQDLMKDDQAALKSGKKTRVEVAQSAMELADKADSEAAKLLLMKGAFSLYVRAGEFDKAIETLQSMQAAIPDMPPANMAGIIESSLRVVSRKNGGQLYRLLDETKTRMRYTTAVKSLEKSVKQNPADRALRTKLAEHYAYLGQWDKALENFAAADGKVGAIAKSEREGDVATEKIADFWWSYPTGKAEELIKCFRAHAANLYARAVETGALTGLNKVQAERRIDEAKTYGEFPMQECDLFSSKVIKLRLAAGVDLELIKCPEGDFTMGYENWDSFRSSLNREARRLHKVELTKDFMLGRFPITQAQWAAIMSPESRCPNDMADIPIANINVAQMEEYCERITKKFRNQLGGRVFRLPTEAEWEYASKGGKNLDGFLGKDRRLHEHNSNVEDMLHKLGYMVEDHAKLSNGSSNFVDWGLLPVGKFKPNEWGFQDMTGNAWEVTADKVSEGPENAQGHFRAWNGAEKYQAFEVDPCRNERYHLIRGGFWERGNCGPSEKRSITDQCKLPSVGFRICLGEKIGGKNPASSLRVVSSKNVGTAVPAETLATPQELAQMRVAKDSGIYGESLREVESLYATFAKTGDRTVLQTLIDKYPKANRTGCAVLYLAQKEAGLRRTKLLNQVIQNFSDCYYADGCNVGARARLLLVDHLMKTGELTRAKAVAEEIRREYANAVNHNGGLIVEQLNTIEGK